jgi:hypothetical protein
LIENYSFGTIVVAGKTYTSDIKIMSGTVVPGWWRKSGHSVCIDDVVDLLAIKPKVLIIGQGKPGLMRVDEALRSRLHDLDLELIEEPTAKAVEVFNQLLAQGKNIAAGFHLTC